MAKQWYSAEQNPHQELNAALTKIEADDRGRQELNLRHLRMYGGRALAGLLPTEYYKQTTIGSAWGAEDNSRLTWNVCQSVCDSIQAKIAANKPRPWFLTSGGNWTQQNRAKKMSKFVDGVFYEETVYQKSPRVLLDAQILGTGAMHVFSSEGRIRFERVGVWELFIDPVEAVYGEPRNLFRVKYITKEMALAMFGDDEANARAINMADSRVSGSGVRGDSDMIKIIEAWHLPTGVGDDEGRHVICIEGATLFDEPYNRSKFPFAFMRWADMPYGFWGQGIIERITGIQIEVNRILQDIQERFHLCSKPMMMVPRGSKIEKKHIINRAGIMVEYSGDVPPQIVAFQTTHPEVFQHLERLYVRSFEQAGASQLSATSRKPSGLNSGEALRAYNDIETERFIIDGQAYENFHIELANLAISEAREMADRGEKIKVKAIDRKRGKTFIESIDWKSVQMDEQDYVLKAFPVSALPTQPSGRMATVEQWIATGMISKEQGKILLDFPDLEGYNSLEFSAYEIVLDAIEKMTEDGIYFPPEPYQDLNLTLKLMTFAYSRARIDGVPEEHLQLIRDYIAATEDLMQRAQPPAPPAGPPMGGPPGLPPGAPPPQM